MKASKVFWGTLFVAAGTLLLLAKLNFLTIEFGSLWRYWPVVLILWGIGVLTGARPFRILIAIVAALVLAVMVYASMQEWVLDGDRHETTRQNFVEGYGGGIRSSSFRFVSGAGTFRLRDTCADLFRAEVETSFGPYEFESEAGDSSRSMSLTLTTVGNRPLSGRGTNNVTMMLHAGPAWDLKFEVGAAKLDLDLSPFVVDNVLIKTGAGDVRVTLGDRSQESTLRVEAGVSSVRVRVPGSAGCEIRSAGGLTSRKFEGFEGEGSGKYRTPGFDVAAKKIRLDFQAGISSLRVERY